MEGDTHTVPTRRPAADEAVRTLDLERLYQRHRELFTEGAAFGAAFERAVREWERFLRGQLDSRPYVTLGTAAGLGYVLGGGLPSVATRQLIGLATRVAMMVSIRRLIAAASAPNANQEASTSSERRHQ